MLGRAETSDRQRGSVSLRSACRGILRASSLLLSSSARDHASYHLPAPTDLPLFHASFSSPSSPPSRSLEIPSSLTSQHRLDILSALLHGTRSTAPVRATHARRLREGENLFLFNHDTSTSWVEAHRVLGAIILLVVLLVPMSCASKSSS